MSFSYHNSNPNSIPQRTIDGAGFGKVAIVTGCGSGVGLATTQLFLQHQYQVLGIDLKDMDYSLIAAKDQERFHFHSGDLAVEGECDEVVRLSVAEFGQRIDVLANIAGVMDNFAAADVFGDKEWDRVMAVNLTVPTRMIRAVLPLMKAKQNGSIINVASKSGGSSTAGVAYMASKHGLLGVTKNTAWRFYEQGIRCNAILPGAIDASMGQDNELETSQIPPHPAVQNSSTQHHKPSITPMEIANAILFLASDQARAINGVSLPIDKAWGAI